MPSSLPFLVCALLGRAGLGSLCDPEYAQALARGQECYRAGAYREAASAYGEALGRDGAGFHALVGLAEAWNAQGEESLDAAADEAFALALGHAQCLDEAFPARPEGPYWTAASYGNLTAGASPGEKVALARAVASAAREALRRDPDFGPAYVALGIYERELSGLGFFARLAARTMFGGVEDTSLEESERLLRRAVALQPTSLLARYELGLTLLAAHNKEEGVGELRRVLELAPGGRADVRRQLDAAARLARLE